MSYLGHKPCVGLEPTTLRLRVWCSTDWANKAESPTGIEPAIFRLEGGRLSRLATETKAETGTRTPTSWLKVKYHYQLDHIGFELFNILPY